MHSKATKTGVNNGRNQSVTNTAGGKDTPQTLIIRLGDDKLSTAFKCDHVGCTESFDVLQLLNLHKVRVHGVLPTKKISVFQCNTVKRAKPPSCHGNVSMQAPEKMDDKKVPSCEEKVAHASISQPAPQKVVSGGDKQVPGCEGKSMCANNDIQHGFQKIGKKRKYSSSFSLDEADSSDLKYFKLPNTPVCSSDASSWRNFARKSTGGSRPSKRRRLSLKCLQLKLTKVSTRDVNMPKPNSQPNHSEAQSRHPQPEQTTPQRVCNSRSTFDRYKYKNLELFRCHIRSQLNLPTSDGSNTLEVESASVGSVPDERMSYAPDEVCARVEPFIGNCARTKPFKPGHRDSGHVSHDSALPCSSVLIGGSHPSDLHSHSEDESFPLVILSPMVHRQPSNITERESPITRVPAKLLGLFPQQTDASLSRTTPQGLGSKSPDLGHVETSLCPQQVGGSSAPMVPNDSAIVIDSSLPVCEDVKDAAHTSTVPCADQNSGKLELDTVSKSPSSEYTLRLLETIAKLSGDVEGQRSRK